MYPVKSLGQIDPKSIDAFEQLKSYYQAELGSAAFVMTQACELLESDIRPNDETNSAIALGMLNTLGKRMETLLYPS